MFNLLLKNYFSNIGWGRSTSARGWRGTTCGAPTCLTCAPPTASRRSTGSSGSFQPRFRVKVPKMDFRLEKYGASSSFCLWSSCNRECRRKMQKIDSKSQEFCLSETAKNKTFQSCRKCSFPKF